MIRAMPERKRFFAVDPFPETKCKIRFKHVRFNCKRKKWDKNGSLKVPLRGGRGSAKVMKKTHFFMTTSHRKELPRCIFLANYVQTSDLVVVDVLQKPLVHFPVSCLEQSKPGDHDDDVVLHGGGDGDGQKKHCIRFFVYKKKKIAEGTSDPSFFPI